MRGNRILKPDATYHVTARANRKEMVLYCDAMRTLFLNTIKRAKKKFRFQVHNFCIMGSHIHLIIRPEQGESLSRIMQWLLSVFAMAWNRKHLTSGHVWGERFFSKIIDSMREFVKTFMYVTQNPVKAQIVDRIDEWEFGGLWHFIIGNREILDELPYFTSCLYHWFCCSVVDCGKTQPCNQEWTGCGWERIFIRPDGTVKLFNDEYSVI